MRTQTRSLISLTLFTLFAFGSTAQAALVEWTFSAVVQDIDGNAAGMADFGVTTGTVLSATFLLDSSFAGGQIGDNVWYDGSVLDIDVSAGSFQASLDTTFAAFNTVLVRDQAIDAVGASAALIIQNGTESSEAFLAMQFIGSNGQLVNDTLFPSIPDFANVDPYDGDAFGGTFFSFQATVGGVFTTVKADIIAPQARFLPVPLPGALLLMGSGLLAVFGVGRRT